MDKVLIGSSTHHSKHYSLDQWLDAVRASTYPIAQIEIVDNSQEPTHARQIQQAVCQRAFTMPVHVTHLRIDQNAHRRIALSMEHIRKTLLASECDWWLNIEADIIAPPSAVETILEYAYHYDTLVTGELRATSFIHNAGSYADWLAAPYKVREGDNLVFSCFGCTLFSKRMMQECSFADAPETISTDGWYRYTVVEPKRKFSLVDMPYGVIPLDHLWDGKEFALW